MKSDLIDMGFSGNKSTWNHGVSAATRRFAKLDRGLSSDDWRRSFPMANVNHLLHAYLDYCTELIQLQGNCGARLGNKPFRFQAAWMCHKNFFNWMEKEWKWEGNLTRALKDFAMKLVTWNNDTFGNNFRRKKAKPS